MTLNRTYAILAVLLIGSFLINRYYLSANLPKKPIDKEAVILAFGDSLTYGYGAGPEESYPARLGKTLGHRVINAGVPGELSDAGLKRLPSLLAEYHPKLLILCHGGNDILQKKSTELLRHNLAQMIRLARERGSEVMLIAVPEFGLLHLSPTPLYGELAEQYHLPIESDILSDILLDDRYKSDYIHPNALGYQKMAEAVGETIKDNYMLRD